MDYAGLLADDIVARAQEVTDSQEQDVDYVSEHPELVVSEYGVNDVRTKEWIPVKIVVSSLVVSEYVNDGPLFADAMVHRDAMPPYIEVVLNGAYRWRKLKELRYQLVKDLYTTLLHELTHISDLRYRDGHPEKHSYRDAGGDIDDDKYYSDKFEVTAFVQEVCDEALQRAEDFVRSHRNENYTRTQLIDYVSSGRTWKQRVGNMRPTDQARVMKAVYSTLVDAGLI
jgi:hypothetical protein